MSAAEVWITRVVLLALAIAGIGVVVETRSGAGLLLLVCAAAIPWKLPPAQRRQVVGF